MLSQDTLLSLLVWVPILGGLATLALSRRAMAARWFALLVSLATLALSVAMFVLFDPSLASMQLVQDVAWVPEYGIRYHLGVDGISVALVMLTAFTTVFVLIGAWRAIEERMAEYLPRSWCSKV